jgi:hypothetical protein
LDSGIAILTSHENSGRRAAEEAPLSEAIQNARNIGV